MYEKHFITQAVNRSAAKEVDRRRLFTMLGVAGAGAAVATVAGGATAAQAADSVDDGAVLNFALNLEYLEAEFYLRAVTGKGLNMSDAKGGDDAAAGAVFGGHEVPWKSAMMKSYAREIARDEREHVRFLRKALGGSAVARPTINFDKAFTAAAVAAGVIKKGQKFDAFANETNFLLGAFLFEDVGVTAYKGAAGLIKSKTYLDAAAGILAVEAYHAGAVRTLLTAEAAKKGKESLWGTVQKLSDARDRLDGPGDDDQGISQSSYGSKRPINDANLTPTDRNGIAYGRTPGQVLNIVYLNLSSASVSKGGFYPRGFNGAVKASASK
ncbi:ferritin-like domain-containing protein [Amnibacterium endophyticum]|uniref:Ferritin-like domain-containing protein n=1 Tax=Amnibacterium endophyticum TaxID=2109337 RepID=A0ABW4LDT4_9MICO